MKEKKPLVVVLSRTPIAGLNTIKSLGMAGYTVDLIASTHKTGKSSIAASSEFVRNSVEIVSRKSQDGIDELLLEEILKYEQEDEKVVLFPTDDYTMFVVESCKADLEENFIFPGTTGADSVIACMGRDYQRALAEKHQFKMVKEWNIRLDDIDIPEDLQYPCICKPYDLINGTKSDLMVFEDEETLKSNLHRMRRKDSERSVVIQEYLAEREEYIVSGACFDQDIFIPACLKVDAYATYKPTVALSGQICPSTELAEMQPKLEAFLKDLHLTGLFEAEFIVSNGTVYFNEVNLHGSAYNFAYQKAGVNLPEILVQHLCREAHDAEAVKEAFYGKRFVLDHVARIDYKKEFMTEEDYNALVNSGAFMAVRDDEDAGVKEWLDSAKNRKKKSSLKKRLKKFIKKRIKRYILPLLRPIRYTLLRYPQQKKANRRNPNAEKPRVVVCGRNYGSNLCIARAIGQAGYEVEIVRVFHRRPKLRQVIKLLKPDAYSKYVKAFYTCIYGGKSWRVTNRLIKIADPDRKMLLIPADDLVACIADNYLEELKPYYILPNASDKAGEINRLMSKGVQKELALKAGLPVVNSCVINTVHGEFEIPDTVSYPCFIKPNISKNGSKTKMQKCESKKELEAALTALSEKKDVEMLVEDFVEIAREHSILGVSTKNGAIGPGFFVAEEGGQHEHRGIAITGKVQPCSVRQELVDDIVKFVGSLNFEGLYDVDLLETVDGKMYFIEVNMRFGGSGYGITASGMNLPGMYADLMLMNKPLDMNCKLENTGKRFVSEKILLEEYINNRMSWDRVKEIMDEVDIHFIQDENDPAPYRHFKRFYPVAALMRTYYKIKQNFENEEFEK